MTLRFAYNTNGTANHRLDDALDLIADSGYDGVALRLAGFFTDRKRLAFRKAPSKVEGFGGRQAVTVEPRGRLRYRGEIVLLTSTLTASAAEIFVLALLQHPRVTRIGEPTQGILSDVMERHLPNGWRVTLSNELYIASDDALYEDDLDLIEDILDISRIESGRIQLYFKEVDIPMMINDVAQSLSIEAERKNMTVNIEVAADLPLVSADQKRLTQVILNLFSNAVKYTFTGGQIWVRVFLNPANMLQVEVEDTGVGMSPEQQAKLFRPFYRADNPLRDEVGGTGLGLSIARSLVEQHNGEMWVQSEQGKGSTFSFIIPLQQPEVTDKADGDDE